MVTCCSIVITIVLNVFCTYLSSFWVTWTCNEVNSNLIFYEMHISLLRWCFVKIHCKVKFDISWSIIYPFTDSLDLVFCRESILWSILYPCRNAISILFGKDPSWDRFYTFVEMPFWFCLARIDHWFYNLLEIPDIFCFVRIDLKIDPCLMSYE